MDEKNFSSSVALTVKEVQAFDITVKELQDLVDPKDFKTYETKGGLNWIVSKLGTDIHRGLKTEMNMDEHGNQVLFGTRKKYFGANVIPPAKSTSIFRLILNALSDKTLIILIIAALISIAIGIYEQVKNGVLGSWVEGIAILVAVTVVVLVNSANDWQKEKQFRKLNAKKEDRDIQVIRNGEQCQVSIHELVTGDLCALSTGEIIPADGVFIDGHNLKCDESGMTGESDAIKKSQHKDPFLLSGTKVLDGMGTMIVIAVGPYSLNGKTMLSLRTDAEDTPLQIKLGHLAETIGKLGLSAAILMLIILIIRYFVQEALNPDPWPPGDQIAEKVVGFFITAVTIVVVAVPEGLPMAVTLALAYATIQMLKDNNLVRVLAACETMGGATTICSDKTGTLTQNKMTVVRGFIGLKNEPDGTISSTTEKKVIDVLLTGIALNSTAYEGKDESGKVTFVGSKTECALLGYATSLGCDYLKMREEIPPVKVYPFSSEKKRMSMIIKIEGGYRMFTKGASEIVLSYCTNVMKANGEVSILEPTFKNDIEENINKFATDALRTIGLAYKDIMVSQEEFEEMKLEEAPEHQLTFIGLVGIQDPLRPEVPHAIEQCKRAGIKVRMVTGDNIVTARNIAKNCGILTKGGIVLEGSEFRRLTIEQMDRVVPNLQVLARSSPTDKQLLVERLKHNHETVAVTGDGTNDAPALKLADVGFAMGIAGTEVAKEASDIILMDDNFASIVKAVIWGRAVFDSVRKFLQFQLTVNITAVTLAFISAVTDGEGESVLTAVQLLWVNLIMDTMAALALATEPPTEELLNRKPQSKRGSLINFPMWKMILGQATFQVAVNLLLLYLGPKLFGLDVDNNEEDRRINRTIVFNTFVFMQIFNELNARRIDDGINIFRRIHKHTIFLVIYFITVVVQALVTEFGGEAFKTTHLIWQQWLSSVGIAFLTLPIGLILRLIPDCRPPKAEVETHHVTREKLLWENAIRDVQTQLRVVGALRRHRDSYL